MTRARTRATRRTTTLSPLKKSSPKQDQVTTIRIVEAHRLPVESSTYSLSTKRNSARALPPETLRSRTQDSLLSVTVNQPREGQTHRLHYLRFFHSVHRSRVPSRKSIKSSGQNHVSQILHEISKQSVSHFCICTRVLQ
jgi:hypothetical protein